MPDSSENFLGEQPGPKYKITQQALSDFSATIAAKPNLTTDEIFKKFPEFNNDPKLLQSALDYSATSQSGKYKTVDELNSKFPEFDFTDPQKKSDGSGGLLNTINQVALAAKLGAPAEPTDAISLFKKANQLAGKKKTIPTPVGAGGFGLYAPTSIQVTDEDAQKKADKINADLKEQGYDPKQLNHLFGDVPDEWYNMPNFTKDKLLQGLKENPEGTERFIAATKYQNQILESLRNKQSENPNTDYSLDENTLLNSGKSVNYGDKRKDNAYIIQLAKNSHLSDDEKEKAIANIATDKSFSYGQAAANPSFFQNDPLSKILNPNQIAAYQYVKDIFPEKAEGFAAAFVNPDAIKNNDEAKIGQEEKLQKLEEIGIGLKLNAATEQLNPIKKEYTDLLNLSQQRPLTPDELNRAKALEKEGAKFHDIINQAQEENATLPTKYPNAAFFDADSFAQELLGQEHGFLSHVALTSGKATGNTINGVVNFVKEPFLSDQQKHINQLEILGGQKYNEQSTYLTQPNQMDQSFTPKVSPQLQADVDAIKNNKLLSDSEKRKEVTSLLMTRSGEWHPNPIEGGKTNIGLVSLAYGVGDLAANLAPFIATEAMTGGGATAGFARRFTSLFTSAAATSFQETYAHAIEEGVSDPYAYATRVTAINSLAMAGADAPGAIRKLAGAQKTPIGDMVSKLKDSEILSALRTEPQAFSVLKKTYNIGAKIGTAALESGKVNAKIISLTTGGQVVNDLIDGKVKNVEDYAKQAGLELLKGTIAFSIPGLIGESKMPDINKAALYEAGRNPMAFREALDQRIKNGSMDPQDATQIKANIDNASEVFKKVPFVDAKGDPLSDKGRRDLMFLKMQEHDIESHLNKDLPKELQETMQQRLVDTQDKMDNLYKGTFIDDIIKPTETEKLKSISFTTENKINGTEATRPIKEQVQEGSVQENGGKSEQSGQPRQNDITPHKEVKTTLQNSIDEISQRHDLDIKEANALYDLKGKDVEKEISEASGETEKIYDSLYDKGFISYAEEGMDRLLDSKGEDFIKAVDARLDTRRDVKEGTDLFPEDASIPELQNVKLNKAEENLANRTFTNERAKRIVEDHGLTLETLDQHKDLFNKFPFTKEDYQTVKEYLNDKSSTNNEGMGIDEIVSGANIIKQSNEWQKAISTKDSRVVLDRDINYEGHPELKKGSFGKVIKPENNGMVVIEYKTKNGKERTASIRSSAVEPALRSSDIEISESINQNKSNETRQLNEKSERAESTNIGNAGDKKTSTESKTVESSEVKNTREADIKAFNDKVDSIADSIIDFITPKHIRNSDIKKSGLDAEIIVRSGADLIKAAYKAGKTIGEAVDEAIKHIKDNWNEKWGVLDEAKLRTAFTNGLAKEIQGIARAPQTGKELQLSKEKFKKATTVIPKKEKGVLSKTWNVFKNLSYWLDNPNRYITELQKNIEKHYRADTHQAIPLGRQFEQNSTGQSVLNVKDFVDTVLKGLKKKDLAEFHDYIFARRIKDRLEQQTHNVAFDIDAVNRETGNITLQDAVNVLADMNARLGKDKMADFEKRADNFQMVMDKSLNELVDSGLLSKEAYDNIKAENDFYAPFNVVQELNRYDEGKAVPTVPASTTKKIKGIEFKDGVFATDALQKTQEALNEGAITKEEFYNTALSILDQQHTSGKLSDAEYFSEMNKLSNSGFTITNIFDKAATIIYDATRLSHKNELLNRLAGLQKYDKEGIFIKKVDGHELRYDKDGSTVSVPKKLQDIKVEDGFGVIGYKKDGKQKFLAINRKAANTINRLDKIELATWMKGLNAVNAAFRTSVITLSPSFQYANAVIDGLRFISFSRYGLFAGKNIKDGVANALLFIPQYMEAILHSGAANIFGKQSSLYKEFVQSKGFSRGMFDDLYLNKKRELKTYPKSFAEHIKFGGLDKVFRLIEGIGTTFEQSHKIVSTVRGMDIDAGIRVGVTRWKNLLIEAKTPDNMAAALDRIAYETQNYAGSPNFPATHSILKVLSVVFQFFSARLKGEASDFRRLGTMFIGRGEGLKMTKGERLQSIAQFAAVATPIVLIAMNNHKDDDSSKEFATNNPWDKDNNMMIPMGQFKYKDEDGKISQHTDYVKIPLRGITSTVNVMANSFLQYAQTKNKKELYHAIAATLLNASPLNLQGDDARELSESLISNTTPTFKSYLELSTNRNTFRHQDLIPDSYGKGSMLQKYKSGKIKVYEVATKKTPQWAIDLSKTMYESSGIEMTPITIDYLENTFLGNISESVKGNVISRRVLRSDSNYPVYKDY